MVKHKVHHHTRHRDVKPKRQSPSGNAAVPRKISPRRPVKSYEYQRHNHDRENCVRGQDGEIKRTNQTLTSKFGGAVIVVISQIGNQEQRRGQYCRDLAGSVRPDATEPDEPEAREQKQSAG